MMNVDGSPDIVGLFVELCVHMFWFLLDFELIDWQFGPVSHSVRATLEQMMMIEWPGYLCVDASDCVLRLTSELQIDFTGA
jgi:hypothetical protein